MLVKDGEEDKLAQALWAGAPARSQQQPGWGPCGLQKPQATQLLRPSAFAPASPLQTEGPPGLGDVTAAGDGQASGREPILPALWEGGRWGQAPAPKLQTACCGRRKDQAPHGGLGTGHS